MTQTNEQSAAQILRDAWELISDRDHWTQFAMARRADGTRTAVEADDATAWCAAGAVHRVVPTPLELSAPLNDALQALGRASRQLRGRAPTALNDYYDHEDVALMFKHAIEDVERWQLW